ncbi:MAG TPA: hypothetical protein VEK38_02415 [Candidatus Bathyarchaeia archaeon]|nr:hypothetical protein [Candidatus Bathyarchaeia archaeon]
MSFIDFFPWIMTKITVVNRYAMRFSCPQLFLNQEQGYLFLVDNEKKNIHVIKLSNYPDYSAIHTFFSQLVPEEVLYVQKVYKAQVNENKKLIPMTIFEGEKSQEEKIVEKIKSKPIGNIIMKCLLE